MRGGSIDADDFSDPHFILGLKAFLSHLHFIVFKRMYRDDGEDISISEVADIRSIDTITIPEIEKRYDISDFTRML